jgi:hypothetical protein
MYVFDTHARAMLTTTARDPAVHNGANREPLSCSEVLPSTSGASSPAEQLQKLSQLFFVMGNQKEI